MSGQHQNPLFSLRAANRQYALQQAYREIRSAVPARMPYIRIQVRDHGRCETVIKFLVSCWRDCVQKVTIILGLLALTSRHHRYTPSQANPQGNPPGLEKESTTEPSDGSSL